MATLMTPFDPVRHGFAFPNWFEWTSEPNGRWRISYGLCGGMCFAALDYWYANRPIPNLQEAPQAGILWAYLVRRQIDSLKLPWGVWRVFWWVLQSDQRLAEWTVQRELPRLREHLARGEPSVLLLIRKASLFSLTENHQVLAFALEEDERLGEALIRLYDPNYPHETRTILVRRGVFSPAGALQDMQGEPLRGFYGVRYHPVRGAVLPG